MDELQQKIVKNIQANKLFDEMLGQTKTVTAETLNDFDMMYNYDAASAISLLKSKLRLIKAIINDGEAVTVEETPFIVIHTIIGLKSWIMRRYPGLTVEDVFEADD